MGRRFDRRYFSIGGAVSGACHNPTVGLAFSMPTVMTLDGFTVKIYFPPREHGPAHVHVFREGKEVLIGLAPVAIRENYGMRSVQILKAVRIVEDNLEMLQEEWRRIHD